MKIKSNQPKVKVNLIYKPSPEATFRLFQALKILISEEDIINYLLKEGVIPHNQNKIEVYNNIPVDNP